MDDDLITLLDAAAEDINAGRDRQANRFAKLFCDAADLIRAQSSEGALKDRVLDAAHILLGCYIEDINPSKEDWVRMECALNSASTRQEKKIMTEETINVRYARLNKEWETAFEAESEGPKGGFLGAAAEEDLLDDVKSLLAENDRLKTGLHDFGQHNDDCIYHDDEDDIDSCDCGFHKAWGE